MITAKLNADAFLRRARTQAPRRTSSERTSAAAVGANAFGVFIQRASRRDTNRFVRGWAIANNLAGLPSLPVPNVVPSRHAATYLKILGDQVDAFSAMVGKYEYLIESRFRRVNRPMRGNYYNELSSALTRAYTRLDRAREELRNAARKHSLNIPDYLFIGLYNKDGIYRPMRGAKTRGRTARQLATIRTKVYGGEGRMIVSAGVTVFQLHNLEPHTTLVNNRWGYVTSALKVARLAGVRAMGTSYVRGLQQSLGIEPMGVAGG